MYPKPLLITSDNFILKEAEGKPTQKLKIEDISDKELLLRLVTVTQSIRSMVLLFVWIAIIEIVAGIVILAKLLK